MHEFPVILLTGPRGSGKTTLLKYLFEKRHSFVSMEFPDIRAAATSDPGSFLEKHPPPVMIDEIQYAPALLSCIQERADSHRGLSGQFLLTGSQNPLLVDAFTESLGGLASMLHLLPLSQQEEIGAVRGALPWDSEPAKEARPSVSRKELKRILLRGRYPGLVLAPEKDPWRWHGRYVQTYLERDVRSLRHVGKLTRFQNFLRMLAAWNGQLLNLTEIARNLGVAVNTIKAWVRVLEATYQVIVLRPFTTRSGRRLVRTPKVFFADSGTLCYLAGIKEPEPTLSGPAGEVVFKSAVISEFVKSFMHSGKDPRLHFWRTSYGTEVDLVIDTGLELIPVSITTSATPRRKMTMGIRAFQKDFKGKATKGYLVHTGKEHFSMGPEVTALPFSAL